MREKAQESLGLTATLFLCLFAGGYFLCQKTVVTAKVLGENIVVPEEILAMKISPIQNNEIVLPQSAVKKIEDQDFIFTIKNGVVQEIPIEIKPWRQDYAKVVAGLEGQELVVLNNKMIAGQKINFTVINPEAGESGKIQEKKKN